MTTSKKIAAMLLETKAVKLNVEQPFKWSSGWNSPIYCDNRVTLSYSEVRTFIKKSLAKAIKKAFPDVEAIAGVATAGIAQGALVAEALGLPFLYVRPKPKEHGMGNQIEGRIEAGQKIVVIEDLISTGSSSLKAVDAIREAGAEVLGMAAIFTYGFKIADNNFKEKDIKLLTLSNYNHLIEEAIAQNYIPPTALDSLKKWRRNPEKWGK
jgi:orotate phosphoribosyltransferase